ncbi:MAG: hypothetical protein CBB66_03895 [bacterium TMED6]|nr:MAG: hypothetical protein CBB66_03895 [bacterium TMED6]|tara:strand:+ start:2233 stop:3978 length:1746 start_codon:yes stop_codon:yes gene_type:complete
MKSLIFTFLLLIQPIFSNTDYFFIDTLNADIQLLLDYKNQSKQYTTKAEKAKYFNDISFAIYDQTLNLQENTKTVLLEYSALINNLEERLNIELTSISYNLGAPFIRNNFKHIAINRKNLKNNLHISQTDLIKNQYLELARYHYEIIDICEKRVDKLLSMLDENSLDRLFNEKLLNKNIIIMNFNNQSNNEKYDKLISVFPDMIINRYKNRDDISVTYSGSIEPDLRKIIKSDDNNSVRYLIDGSFIIDGYNIIINFKVYDINDWSLKVNRDLSCDIRDIDCVYDSFLWNVKESVDPLVEYEIYDDFSNIKSQIMSKIELDSSDISIKSSNLFMPVLEDFAIQKDYSFDINYKDMGINGSESVKTQSFDLSNYPNGVQTRKELLADLVKRLNSFLTNPYSIDVGELDMEVNKLDNSYVDLNISISYSFKKRDFEKLIKNMPYNTLKSNNNSYTVEFLHDNYLFDVSSINQFNNHSRELFPVLFFANKKGDIQKIIIDSWDNRYDNLLFGDYDVERVDKFSQLYSIIKSDKNMHFNINKNKVVVNYNTTMPISILDNYTQLTIKIFERSDLDSYLPINELKF